MSYTNGVGGSQPAYSPADVAAASQANASAKTEQSTASTSTASASSAAVPAANDQASLSTAGGLIAQALTGSDVRSDKVAALQQQISAGTYNVPASDVADKVMSSLLE